MKHRVSEVFGPTIQGEGMRTGVMSVWVRTFGCNLECNGFFQNEPTKPETYILPYKGVDFTKITKMEDLPVFDYGCDSSYSWSAKYKHLTEDYTTASLADKVYSLLPGGKFKHPVTGQTYDFCITGGEPMMQQKQTVALLNHMMDLDNFPYDIQIETNGTKALSPELAEMITKTTAGTFVGSINWFWSISPKLFNVSGETDDIAWKPGYIRDYFDCNPKGWLKFVVNDREETWTELKRKVAQLRDCGCNFPVMIMPVGATASQQMDSKVLGKIADRAVREGYHVSGRLHAILWGNTIGV
jgi:organic radical activating enzyme